jgi:cell wall-associated NlpC family hydrolase
MTAETVIEPLTAALTAPRPRLDRRSHIATTAIVDIALAGQVAAASYVAPVPMQCAAPQTPMRADASAEVTAVSELLCGEGFDLFDSVGGWGFGRSCHDRYTGWVALAALRDGPVSATHIVTAPVAPLFSQPDIKSPVMTDLPFGARVGGSDQGKFLAVTSGGYLHQRHLAPPPETPLTVARLFVGAPYVWGGRTPRGVDCSGLVQAALIACGIACPRDSDQQRDALGRAVKFADRRGGDIIFFPGHVGILVDADTLLHANAHWMAVVEEPLAEVIARLADTPHPVTGVRRIG